MFWGSHGVWDSRPPRRHGARHCSDERPHHHPDHTGTTFLYVLVILNTPPVLKDKLRRIKILRIYLSTDPFELGSTKLEMVRSPPLTGAWRKAEAKQGN